jgi:hypothetical protein
MKYHPRGPHENRKPATSVTFLEENRRHDRVPMRRASFDGFARHIVPDADAAFRSFMLSVLQGQWADSCSSWYLGGRRRFGSVGAIATMMPIRNGAVHSTILVTAESIRFRAMRGAVWRSTNPGDANAKVKYKVW